MYGVFSAISVFYCCNTPGNQCRSNRIVWWNPDIAGFFTSCPRRQIIVWFSGVAVLFLKKSWVRGTTSESGYRGLYVCQNLHIRIVLSYSPNRHLISAFRTTTFFPRRRDSAEFIVVADTNYGILHHRYKNDGFYVAMVVLNPHFEVIWVP